MCLFIDYQTNLVDFFTKSIKKTTLKKVVHKSFKKKASFFVLPTLDVTKTDNAILKQYQNLNHY